MKIKLLKGALVYLTDGIAVRKTVVCEKDILFDREELFSDLAYKKRWYNYIRPWPVYEGMDIKSIEWNINSTNERVILD